MRLVKKILAQSLGILALSAALAFAVNAVRPDGLPLAHAAPSAVQADSNGEIGIKDAAMLFVSNRAVFLDARSQFEYELGHIQGALSLPLREFASQYQDLKPWLAGKEAVITYCDGELCPLGQGLAQHLRDAGIKNVYVLKNGWSQWRAEKLPTATGPMGQAGQTGGQPGQKVQKGSSSSLKAARQEAQCTDCAN